MMTEVETGEMQLQANDCWPPPEVGRGKEEFHSVSEGA